jgi:hypothetical protein
MMDTKWNYNLIYKDDPYWISSFKMKKKLCNLAFSNLVKKIIK